MARIANTKRGRAEEFHFRRPCPRINCALVMVKCAARHSTFWLQITGQANACFLDIALFACDRYLICAKVRIGFWESIFDHSAGNVTEQSTSGTGDRPRFRRLVGIAHNNLQNSGRTNAMFVPLIPHRPDIPIISDIHWFADVMVPEDSTIGGQRFHCGKGLGSRNLHIHHCGGARVAFDTMKVTKRTIHSSQIHLQYLQAGKGGADSAMNQRVLVLRNRDVYPSSSHTTWASVC